MYSHHPGKDVHENTTKDSKHILNKESSITLGVAYIDSHDNSDATLPDKT